jgi:hypothetical protein
MLSGEVTYANFLVFFLPDQGSKPTMYHTWGMHVDHYTNETVVN